MQHQLNNGFSSDSYGGSSQLQRQQMQQQSLRSSQSADQSNYMSTASRSGGYGLGGLSLNGNSNSNLSGMYGGGLGSGNRSIGDLGGAAISAPLGSRVISSQHSGSSGVNGQQQQFDSSFPTLSSGGSGSLLLGGSTSRGYSAVAQLGASTPLSRADQDFSIDDFPALPGSSLLNKGLADQVVGSHENKLLQSQQQNGSQILNQGANNMFSGSGSMLGGDGSMQQQSHPLLGSLGSSQQQSGAVHQAVTKEQKFGLAGLLDVIRFTDKDINTLALGTDLTTFGLNLNSSDSLYPSFSSPFTDVAQATDPQFSTPACYMMHPPSLKSEHLSKFQIETLFYMFYAMPRDILQACASQELYRRDWRYHGELKVWLKQRAPQELMQSHPNVQFVFFDSSAWETRLFVTAQRGNITAGLLSEDEVRVKVPQPNSIPLGGQGGGSLS